MQKYLIIQQKEYNISQIEQHIRDIFSYFNLSEALKNKNRILIKPNLLGAHHPDKAVTTHPVIVEAVIKEVKKYNNNIILGDSPAGTVSLQHVWQTTGMKTVCEKYNIPLVDFGKDGIINTLSNKLNHPLYFDKHVMESDVIINLAKMKTHGLMLYTGAVKNLYGTIPGLYKSELHKLYPSPDDFSKVLTVIYEILKPKIVINIIDGIIGMEGKGPAGGTPYPFGVLITSEKATVADYIASEIMGFDIETISYLKESLINDEIDYRSIDISKINKKKIKIKSVVLANKLLNKMPKIISGILRIFLYKYPSFKKNCIKCLICAQGCPVQAINCLENKMVLDKNKCIKCLCCHEMCPENAIKL